MPVSHREVIMKKILSFILSLTLVASLGAFFALGSSAEEGEVSLPAFTFPLRAYPTLEDAKIPYDELLACFPEINEVKYENGVLYIKDVGGVEANYVDTLNYDYHHGKLVDGYWEFDVSVEEYNSAGSISISARSRLWSVEYELDGKRSFVTFDNYIDGYRRLVMLYPEEGYYEKSVDVSYSLRAGLDVSDEYAQGVLNEQTVALHTENESIWAIYGADGTLLYVDVAINDTGEYVVLLPDKGWCEDSNGEIPVKAPQGFENVTLEELAKRLPTDITCDHQWSAPLCDVPSICEKCFRENGEPLGHKLTAGDEYDTCSTCNAIIYRLPSIALPSFAAQPVLTLAQIGIDANAITSSFPPKIITEYENGIFTLPCIEECDLTVKSKTDGFIAYNTANGRNTFEIENEDIKQLEFTFDGERYIGENCYEYSMRYDCDGALLSCYVSNEQAERTVSIILAENKVDVTYPKSADEDIEYTDTYVNGILTSQAVFRMDEGVRVCYDSDLNVSKVSVRTNGSNDHYIPDKGWFDDSACTKSIPTPSGYEDKDAAYFAKNYPTSITFCIHAWKDIEGGKECTKCGEKVIDEKPVETQAPDAPQDNDMQIGLIIGIAVGVIAVVAVAAVSVIVLKKKSSARR